MKRLLLCGNVKLVLCCMRSTQLLGHLVWALAPSPRPHSANPTTRSNREATLPMLLSHSHSLASTIAVFMLPPILVSIGKQNAIKSQHAFASSLFSRSQTKESAWDKLCLDVDKNVWCRGYQVVMKKIGMDSMI